MASKIEAPSESGSSTKLPIIREGQSLVSSGQTSRSRAVSPKEQALSWATGVRERIGTCMISHKTVDESDICELKQELVALVITVLQKDNRQLWCVLREVLALLEPISCVLQNKQELQHYLERLLFHLDLHKERLFDLHIQDALTKAFPQDVAEIQDARRRPKKKYCAPVPPPAKTSPPSSVTSLLSPRQQRVHFRLPDGSTPYKLINPEDSWQKPKGVTFGDIRGSLADVALETATREAIWSGCLGTTAVALNTDIMDEPEKPKVPQPPVVMEILKTLDQMSQASDEAGPEAGEAMTGRAAVEYFSKCFHTGKIKFMYFNIAPSRHFKPYDLIAVPKNKANPEHYVFSTFGVLHIYPDAAAENMSLADWQRQAVLYRAISHLPFFKNFLMTKMFNRWRTNRHFAEFVRIRHAVSESLLQNVPSYGGALLQVYKLCCELLHLQLLPLDTETCRHLHEFEQGINHMNKQTGKVMERFFRYTKAVVENKATELYKKVQYCEDQVKQKTVFTKDSLYVQRTKQEERENNLHNAKVEMSRLGGFIRLVDQILLSHLVALSRTSIVLFVNKTMKGDTEAEREAFLHAVLVFNPEDKLSLSPSKEHFLTVLNRTVTQIPSLCCNAAESFGGETQLPEPRDEDDDITRSPVPLPSLSSRDPSFSPSHRDSRRLSQVLSSLRDRRAKMSLTGHSTRLSTLEPLVSQSENKPVSEGSITAREMIGTPQLHQESSSDRPEDDPGHATPSMVLPRKSQSDLVVSGVGIMGNHKPLSSANLEEKLKNDEACQAALNLHGRLMSDALEEVDELCQSSSWINTIQAFCKSWNEESVYQWRGAAAFTIEQKLNELRLWTEKIRNFDRTYRTENGIFYIDCSLIHDNLIPKLNQIFRELCTFVAEESVNLAKTFSEEMKKVTKHLKVKDTSIGGFARYAKNVSRCRENKAQYQQRVEYIKSLFEVIRMSFRQLTPEEERLEEGVWTLWEAFLFHWQDAVEFVNIQRPLITQNLEENYQQPKDRNSENSSQDPSTFLRLEEEARTLSKTATTGKFLDPSQNPSDILKEIKQLRDQFYEVRKQMQQASKWKEAITGEPYDLYFLSKMALEMDIRQELWKYVEVSTHTILDWRNQLFRKFNVRKALDKVTEWLAAAGQLKAHMPPQDGVITHWYRTLQDFRRELPLLHKLTSVALKTRHWKVIFTNLGEQYHSNHQFLVDELLAFNLSTHSAMITSVYQAALSEFAVEQQLIKLQRMWQEKEFKVAKHIPDSVYREDARVASPEKKKRNQKAEKNMMMSHGVELGKENLYILIEVEELKYLLQDSQVALQVMLSSPYLVEHKVEAQHWTESLQEAEEIIDLWHHVQTKWLYLLKIFDDPDFFRKLEAQVRNFEILHQKFTEFMQLMASDPKVTLIMSKARGEKGYRFLQGERLRNMLSELLEQEETMLRHLEGVVDKTREQWPRLYFLSDNEMTDFLAVSRNPRALMPFVHKCFSGIESLTFALPQQEQALNTALDFELNAHKLEVTMLHGALGETVPLYHRLEASSSAAGWMATLESYMKTTVNTVLEACVQARLDEAAGQPSQILEELEKFETKVPASSADTDELVAEIRHSFNHWLLQFPAQCVLTAEAIMWEQTVLCALQKQDHNELSAIKVNLTSRLEQYVKILEENSYNCRTSEMRKRLHCLLGCLINQGLHHRDIVESLCRIENLSDGAYDWMKVLKYHMEISTVLRAKSNSEIDNDRIIDPVTAVDHGQRQPNFTCQDDVSSGRTMTTVQQGYQFGKCVVSQMARTFVYDCEYLGPRPRLAFTPLTERAYLNLTMSLNTFQCGTLSGPPGSGKSDTIQDLAMALGRHLVIVNASESLMIPTMNRFLSGAVQSGCWLMFDHSDRMTQGLLSVLAQQLDYLCNALRVLGASSDNQYDIRGQPMVDKKTVTANNGDKGRIRRNSLTTLHSLPGNDVNIGNLERQSTVPHGFNEDGLITYFEDTWIAEKERRHSVAKEISIRDSEFYKNNRPPPLFYEYVTMHRSKKSNFSDLVLNYAPYNPEYLGHVLLNDHLVRANANYGCFLTVNTANKQSAKIPHNLRMLMRPCAMVKPDMRMVVEVFLYSNGFPNSSVLTSKLCMLFGLLKAQLPDCPQYNISLHCVVTILKLTQHYYHELRQLELKKRPNIGTLDEMSSFMGVPSTGDVKTDELAVLRALNVMLGSMMENAADESTMKNVIQDVFPNYLLMNSGLLSVRPELLKAIKDQLSQDRLQPNQAMVDTIVQLYLAIQSHQPVILAGPAGSGKSTCYRMLAKTLTQLHYGMPAEGREEELIPERSLTFQYTQKLKILKDSDPRESAKTQPKKWQKLSKISTLLNQTMTTFKELASADDPKERYPKIDVEALYPNAYGPKELFGYMDEKTWHGGLITKILHKAHVQSEAADWMIGCHDDRKKGVTAPPTMIQKWIVLDGTLNPSWVDAMATLLDNNKKLSVSSGLSVDLQDATSLILETGTLAHASPSAVARCSMVSCGPELVGWHSMLEAWGQSAKQNWVLNAAGWQVLSSLANSVFKATLPFMEKECSPALLHNLGRNHVTSNKMVSGVQQVTTFLSFMGALLNRFLRRDDLEKLLKQDQGGADGSTSAHSVKRGEPAVEGGQPSGRLTSLSRIEDLIPNYLSVIKSMFTFAFIWGFGGGLHDSSMEKFSSFARDVLAKAPHPVLMPETGLVYDYCADFKTGQFIRWSDRTLERARGVLTHYTVVPEIDRYSYLVDLLLSADQPVLLTGAPGVGKTSLVEYLVQPKHPFSRLPVSPGLSAHTVHNTIVRTVCEPKRQRLAGIPNSIGSQQPKGRHLFFLDDLNTAATDGYGSQPILEVLRQTLNQAGLYDRQRQVFVALGDVDVIAAATCPGAPGSGHGYVCHMMSARFIRLFAVLTLFTPSDSTLYAIHSKTVQTWLEEFPGYAMEHHLELSKALVRGLLDVYKSVRDRLKATPNQSHYIFSLHDLAHVIEGMLLMSPRSRAKPKPKSRLRREKELREKEEAKTKRMTLAAIGYRPKADELSRSGSQGQAVVKEMTPALASVRTVTRLWCHECTRTFADRITEDEDKEWFESLLRDVVTKRFCTGSEDSREKMMTIPETALLVAAVPEMLSSRETTEMTPDELYYLKMDASSSSEDRGTESAMFDSPTPGITVEPALSVTPSVHPSVDKAVGTSVDSSNLGNVATSTPDCGVTTPDADNGNTTIDDSGAVTDPDTVATTDAETAATTDVDDYDEEETESSSSSEESESEITSSSEDETDGDVSSSLGTITGRSSSSPKGLLPRKLKIPAKKRKSPSQTKLGGKSPTADGVAQQKPTTTPSLRRSSSVNKVTKRGVTFKAGLLADREVQRYTGPLLSMDQVRGPGERLTDIIFSRYIQGAHANVYGVPAERGYAEGSEGLLALALSTCLALYNSATNHKLDLVFFKEAIQHTTRLTRTLTTFGGHSLLLAQTYSTGRATLARLAAHVTNCKLFEPELSKDPAANRRSLHDTLKQCSRVAAVRNRPVALLVKEDLGPQCLQDISVFIKEAQCPSLYTESEVMEIATLMTPGQVKVTRIDKVEAAFNKFLLRVRQNLHVIICMNAYGGSRTEPLQARLAQYPVFLWQCCNVDVYQPWTTEALVTVAKQWLDDRHGRTRLHVPWNEHFKSKQVAMVSSVMAYIHGSSRMAIENLHSHQGVQLKLVSPLTFKEFVHVFKVIAAYIVKEETSKMEHYEAALNKVNKAFDSVAAYRREISDLVPKHQAALSVVREHVQFVEVQRTEYISALERCKEQEEIIQSLELPLEELRRAAHAQFDGVRPTYEAAMVALQTLSRPSVIEVRSYLAPPQMVKVVMEAVCLLFAVPPDWEDAHLLLNRDTFFKDLECYDKDSIPEDIFNKLRVYYNNPNFTVEAVQKVSLAAASLCMWVRAIYKYAEVSRAMKPKIRQLKEAEHQLTQAQALLGSKRVQANRIKSALERRIQAHKESMKEAKGIEKQVQTIERRISKASALLEQMGTQSSVWRTELKECRSKVRTAPGDALLAAGCVCYHGPLDDHTRTKLMTDWLNRCEAEAFDGEDRKPQGTYQLDEYDTLAGEDKERTSSSQGFLDEHYPTVSDLRVNHKTEARVTDGGFTNGEQPSIVMETHLEGVDSLPHLLAIRENYALIEVLSSFDEQSMWKLEGHPSDTLSVHNALIARVAVHNRPHSWPLLVDPDNQAPLWVKVLQTDCNIIKETDLIQIGDEESDLPDHLRLSVEDDLGQSPGMTATSEVTEALTEPSTSPTTEVVTPRSGVHVRPMSDLNKSASDLAQAVMAAMSSRVESSPPKFSETIEHPSDNLWTVASDDPQLDPMLVNSVVHGVTLLITHLERQPLKPAFSKLLRREYDVTDDQTTVAIGDQILTVHPDFRLYLSVSVPLFMEGGGVHPLPLPAVAVIDFTTSQERIYGTLLRHVMAIERPEFESQSQSIDRDLIHHQQDLRKEQEAILQKTLTLREALLEEQDMLQALVACQEAVVRNRIILEETYYLQEHREEKRAAYVPVALHGAKLYEIIQRMSVLSPLYHLPLATFTRLFADTVRAHHRGKGTQGALKARAQELINATTGAVYKYASSMMFSAHARLFALLIALEQLRLADKLANQELGLFINGIETSRIEDNVIFSDKVDWISNKVWLDCAALETTFEAFKGLCQSLKENSLLWREYFECDLDLLEPVPGAALSELTVFQKCLLWRICVPMKVCEVSEALVLYELGTVVQEPPNYSLQAVYSHADKAKPIVFILPSDVSDHTADNSSKGFVSVYPVTDLVQFSREVGHQGKVHVVTCGVRGQMVEIQGALQEAMESGHWLVIQNAHLAEDWTREVLQLLKTVVHSKSTVPPQGGATASTKDSTDTFVSTTSSSQDTIGGATVHDDFRLFVTTCAESGTLIPGYLIQYGMKVTCEQTTHFSSMALQTYSSLEKLFVRKDRNALTLRKLFSHTDPLFPLAMFHSVLLHRRLYGNSAFNGAPSWTQADLSTALDQFQLVLTLCQRHRGVPEMIAQIYRGHCHDLQDAHLVDTLAKALLLSPKQLKELPERPPGVAAVLAEVLPSGGESLEQKLERLFDVSAAHVSLAHSADSERNQGLSKNLMCDLMRVCGAPGLLHLKQSLPTVQAATILQDVLSALEALPRLPDPRSPYYPLEAFLQTEVVLLGELVDSIRSDVTLLLAVTSGDVSVTPDTHARLLAVTQQKIPSSWCPKAFPSDLSLSQWVGTLQYRVEELTRYLETDPGVVVVHNMAVFSCPDRFLQSVIQTYARKEFRELHTLKLQAEVLSTSQPTDPPVRGVYVGNLRLHNASWDVSQRSVSERPVGPTTQAALPVVWLNPVPTAHHRRPTGEVFTCPMYVSRGQQSEEGAEVLTTVDVPCLTKPSLLIERRVFAACSIPV